MPGHHPQKTNEPFTIANPKPPLLSGRWRHKKRARTVALIMFLVLLFSLTGSRLVNGQFGKSAPVSVSNGHSGELSLQQVVERARSSVVCIDTTKCDKELGSGVIIDPQGYIVTNWHVVADGAKTVTLFDDSSIPTQMVGVDPCNDLAVLKITTSKHLFAMPIGNSSQLQVGDEVIAIGAPLFLRQTVTFGHISALGRSGITPRGSVLIDTIQTDAAINPGNSGGALVSRQAQLVGIPAATLLRNNIPVSGIAYAIPSNRVKFIVPQLIKYGRVIHEGHSTMGVDVVTVNADMATQDHLAVEHGALITQLQPNGPAMQAGLQVGDVIVQINTTPILTVTNVTDALMPEDPGSIASITVLRGTRTIRVNVTLQEQMSTTPNQCSPGAQNAVIGRE